MKKGIKIVWAVVRVSDGVLFEDACGDSKPFYPIFKTRKDAAEYKLGVYGKSRKTARVVPVKLALAH